jgi:hypothetical protein
MTTEAHSPDRGAIAELSREEIDSFLLDGRRSWRSVIAYGGYEEIDGEEVEPAVEPPLTDSRARHRVARPQGPLR